MSKMAKVKTKSDSKEPAPKVSGFDQGPRDFFRGNQGPNGFKHKFNNRSLIGMRRGAR